MLIDWVFNGSISTERRSDCISPSLPHTRNLLRRSPSSARHSISSASGIRHSIRSPSCYGPRSLRNIGRCANASWPFGGAHMEVLVSTSRQRVRLQKRGLPNGGWRTLESYHAWVPRLQCFWGLCASWSSSQRSSSCLRPFWRYYTRVQEVSLRYVRVLFPCLRPEKLMKS